MQYVYIVTIAFHVVTGVYWAGSAITLARAPEIQAERFFSSQMGAAVVAVLTGLLLWHFFHGSNFGPMEQVLALGALSAVAAAGVQGAFIGSARRKLAGASQGEQASLRTRMAKGQRIAAGLLVLTLVCMAIARFV